jgi:hypothetical protein
MNTEERTQILELLAQQIEACLPGLTVGWGLGLSAGCPEEGVTLLDAFSVAEEDELAFIKAIRPLVREAEARLAAPILVIPHQPEATRTLYADIPQKIRDRRAAGASEATRQATAGRLASSSPNILHLRAS